MSNPLIEPYLFFGGRCEEALEFYRTALGAKIDMKMKFSENPQPMPPGSIPPGFENKIMHASFRIGGSRLMASDGNEEGAKFEGFGMDLDLYTADRERMLGIDDRFKRALADVTGDTAWHALMPFRLGYPTVIAQPSPRRHVEDVIVA